MPTSAAAHYDNANTAQPRGAGGWLALAASPSFALMASIAATDHPPTALCGMQSTGLPLDGMTAMYLLMALFHLAPWLKLVSSRR